MPAKTDALDAIASAERINEAKNAAIVLVLDSLLSMRTDGQMARAVYQQLLDDYSAQDLGWVLGCHWDGPIEVPTDQINSDNRDKWRASHDGTHDSFVEKIKEGIRKPAILVRTPGDPKYIIVDGHHRYLGHEALGLPLLAYVAEVHVNNGPWDELHSAQKKGKSGPRSGSWNSPSWQKANAPPPADKTQASILASVPASIPEARADDAMGKTETRFPHQNVHDDPKKATTEANAATRKAKASGTHDDHTMAERLHAFAAKAHHKAAEVGGAEGARHEALAAKHDAAATKHQAAAVEILGRPAP
jgi:hypothetical protein